MRSRMTGSGRVQLFCVWCAPVGAIGFLVFVGAIARFIPPPSPHWTAAHVAAFFAHHHVAIGIGQIGGMVFAMMFLPLFAVIAVQLARIERGGPLLAVLEFGGAVILIVWFTICSMLWIVATFRVGLSPQTVRVLNDLGWLAFVMVFPEYVVQMLAIAVAALRDTSPDPVWPRWAAYFNLWIAFSGIGGGLAVFFKHGPFAWNGLIGFWIPIVMFAVWLGVTVTLLHRAIGRQTRAERQHAAAGLSPRSPGGALVA
jgi:hypothetical protein